MSKKFSIITVIFCYAAALWSCGSINDSWEVHGGGYFKYTIEDTDIKDSIGLERDDVHLTNSNRKYFQMETREGEGKYGNQFEVTINRALSIGRFRAYAGYSWMVYENSAQGILIEYIRDKEGKAIDSSYFHFDERSEDKWTANVNLYFQDCRKGECNDSLPPVHVTGRFRYYVAAADR